MSAYPIIYCNKRRGQKFTDSEINLIRNIYDSMSEYSGIAIAKMFRTGAPMISMIGRRQIYKQVPFIKMTREEICNSIQLLQD